MMYCVGRKSSLEQALTKDLDPPLTPSFSSSIGTSCVISPANLLQWFNTHHPTASFSCENESVPSQGFSSASASAGSSTNCSTGRDVKAVVESVSKSTASSVSSTSLLCSSVCKRVLKNVYPSRTFLHLRFTLVTLTAQYNIQNLHWYVHNCMW